MNYITCYLCGDIIESLYSEDELQAEFKDSYPNEKAETIIICDECFQHVPEDGITLH